MIMIVLIVQISKFVATLNSVLSGERWKDSKLIDRALSSLDKCRTSSAAGPHFWVLSELADRRVLLHKYKRPDFLGFSLGSFSRASYPCSPISMLF